MTVMKQHKKLLCERNIRQRVVFKARVDIFEHTVYADVCANFSTYFHIASLLQYDNAAESNSAQKQHSLSKSQKMLAKPQQLISVHKDD